MAGMTLSDAIDEFMRYREGAGFRPSTVTTNRQTLSVFLREIGNLQVRHLDARHGEMFQAYLGGKGYKPNTINTHLTTVAAFSKWLHSRRYLPPVNNPVANVRAVRVSPRPRQRVEAADFPALLDAARTPNDRIVVALGLYLFLRQGEAKSLRIKDVHLDDGEIEVMIHKTNGYDRMPICAELDRELRRWLSWYAADVAEEFGPLRPEWYLVPRRKRPMLANDGRGPGGGYMVIREKGNCEPMFPNWRLHLNVQRTLVDFGIPIRAADGKSLAEGLHTLRRSGARAMFDRLVGDSYDGALAEVSAWLHHSNTTTTERYLGIELSTKKRNERIKGKMMFPVPVTGDNVVELRPAEEK